MSDHPVEQAVKRLGIQPLAFLVLVAFSFVAGLTEDSMAPFRSWVYVGAVGLTYYVSVHWGIVQGLFLSTGFVTLLLVGTVFRSQADLASFMSELPLDVFLFTTLAILPGFVVEIYAGASDVVKEQRTETKRKIQALSIKLSDINRQKRTVEPGQALEESVLVRRANQMADAVRKIVAGQTAQEVGEILADALSNALGPQTLFWAQIDSMGQYQVQRVSPDGAPAGFTSLDANDGAVREALRVAKPVFIPTPIEAGEAFPVNLLVPVIVNRSLVALVGMTVESADGRHEIEFASVLSSLSQEVIARFGLPV